MWANAIEKNGVTMIEKMKQEKDARHAWKENS